MGCATAAALQTPSTVLWKAGAPAVVPFKRDAQGRVVVDGAVDGRPATVLLDSGAVGTIVSETLLDRTSALRVDTAIQNSQTRVERWRSIRIDVGPLSIEPPLVVVTDRTGRPDVLIGNPVFEQAVVEFDFEARTVTFHAPEAFTPPPSATALPLGRDLERMTANVSINGGPPVCVGVDLGLNGALSLAPPVVDSQSLPTDPTVITTQQIVGRDLVRAPGLKRIDRVTVAGYDLANVAAIPGGYNSSPCGSLLGTEILSGFHLYFDLSRNTLWLSPRPDLDPRFESILGITYRNTSTGMLVTAIATNSPAYSLLEIGDRVTRIEGEPVAFTLSTGEVRRPPQSASPPAPPEGEQLAPTPSPPAGGSTAEGREVG